MFKDKTFKYFTSQPPGKGGAKMGGLRPMYPEGREPRPGPPQGKGSGPQGQGSGPQGKGSRPQANPPGNRNSNTVPAPAKSRVRVPGNAGDKCVPPAKSRPKKRKSVKGGENALGMDAVEWSDRGYSVKQLVESFGDRFPVIVKVNQGYYGSCGDLSLQQVLQIHSYGKQKRVRAVDSQNKKLSIPLDYPMDVYVRHGDSGERTNLSSLLSMHNLPQDVKVVSVSEDPEFEDDTYNPGGEELRLTDTEETPFLRANSIMDGWVDQLDIYLIPAFLGAEFSVAVGMRGATEEEWLDYHGMFARSVRHLNYQMLTGYKGIVVDGQLPSTTRTSHLSTAPGSLHIDPTFSTPASPPASPPASLPASSPGPAPGQVYENLPESESRKRAETYENLSGPTAGLAPGPKAGLSPGPTAGLSAGPTAGLSPGPALTTGAFDYTLQGVDRVRTLEPPSSDRRAVRRSTTNPWESQVSAEVEVHNRRNLETSPQPASLVPPGPSPGPSAGEEDVEEMFASVISVAMEEEQRRERESTVPRGQENPAFSGSETPPHYRTPANYTPADSLRHNPPPPKAVVQPRVHENNNNTDPSLPRDKNNTYINLARPGNHGNQGSHSNHGSQGNTGSSSIVSMEDVPARIDSLTVSDICACLSLLNMENQVPLFQRRQVDGNLLSSIKENVLINEFKLTPFNASKLMRFIRGWRPKFT